MIFSSNSDAVWLLLLHPIASPYEPNKEEGICVKVDWWPFEIVIQNRLNVKSIRSPDEPLQDKYRIHLKAANMVRFANEFLKRLRRTSAFVVTIYASINLNGDTDR
ncbi:hypothetical protein F5888DRAFT_1393315 [Russula emetica]|nr:hypothetical protein F5888DRAFT_1393315 [Russula emetica]